MEVSVEYGNTYSDKDSSEFSTALLFGVGDDKTNVSGFVDYTIAIPFSTMIAVIRQDAAVSKHEFQPN